MKNLFIYLFIYFAILFSVSFAETSPTSPLLNDVRYSADKEKIRVVLEFDSSVPFYSFFSLLPEPSFNFVVLGCKIKNGLKTNFKVDDKLFSEVNINENDGRFLLSIALKYPLPESNVKVMKLSEKGRERIAVDFYRKFSVSASYLISKDVSLNIEEFSDENGYVRFNELSVLAYPLGTSYFDIVLSPSGRDKVGRIREHAKAVAAVNGGFFAYEGGAPLGLFYRYGQLVSPHVSRRPPRTCFAVLMDGSTVIDRMIAKDGVVYSVSGKAFENAAFVLGGGPRLVSDSKVAVNADEEELGKKGNDITRLAGRTGVGVDSEGRVRLFTASGYFDSHKEGMKLETFAEKMVRSGIVSGMNLDGGGSVAMDILGADISKPLGVSVYERPVGNALCLYIGEELLIPYSVSVLKADKNEILCDGKDFASIEVQLLDASGKPLPDGSFVKIAPSFGGFPKYVKSLGGIASFSIGSMKKAGSFDLYAECGSFKGKIWEGKFVPSSPVLYNLSVDFYRNKLLQGNNFFKAVFYCEDEYGNRSTLDGAEFAVIDADGLELLKKPLSVNSSEPAVFYIEEQFANSSLVILKDGKTLAVKLLQAGDKILDNSGSELKIPDDSDKGAEVPDGSGSDVKDSNALNNEDN